MHPPALIVSIHPSDGADGGFSTCSQLFVALSVKGGAIKESLALRSRAAQTLVVLFMTSALIAVALVTPQSSTAAGVELVMSAVLCGAALLTLDRRALDATEPGVARTIERFSLNDHRAVGRLPSLWQRVSRRRTLVTPYARRCWM